MSGYSGKVQSFRALIYNTFSRRIAPPGYKNTFILIYTWKGEETRRCPFAGALRRPRWKESQRLTPFLVEHYLVKWQRIK